jgi:hypothetical protein
MSLHRLVPVGKGPAAERAARQLTRMMGSGGGLYWVRSWTKMWKILVEHIFEIAVKPELSIIFSDRSPPQLSMHFPWLAPGNLRVVWHSAKNRGRTDVAAV